MTETTCDCGSTKPLKTEYWRPLGSKATLPPRLKNVVVVPEFVCKDCGEVHQVISSMWLPEPVRVAEEAQANRPQPAPGTWREQKEREKSWRRSG